MLQNNGSQLLFTRNDNTNKILQLNFLTEKCSISFERRRRMWYYSIIYCPLCKTWKCNNCKNLCNTTEGTTIGSLSCWKSTNKKKKRWHEPTEKSTIHFIILKKTMPLLFHHFILILLSTSKEQTKPSKIVDQQKFKQKLVFFMFICSFSYC